METDKKSFRKMFPNLSKELELEKNSVSVNSVRTASDTAENAKADKFQNYEPSVVDFIRRCDTKKQALKIITYLEKRGELSEERAIALSEQLERKGLRSFGPKKEKGYYFRQSGFC